VLAITYLALLSIEDVVRCIAPDSANLAARDAALLAIRELVQAGLAHGLDRFVFTTAPAVYLERLGSA
jgi:hypothetical protein